jgi:hypothetical protein
VACFDHGYSRGFERAFNSARSTSGWVEALILVVLSATTLICAGCGDEAEQLERLGPVRRLLLPLTSSRRWPERGRPDADARRRFQCVDRRTETPALTRRRARATASGAMDPQFRFRAPRGLPAATVHALHVANCATGGRVAGHRGALSDRSAVLHCGCESRRCACWPPDGWRLASGAGCRSPVGAVTGPNARAAAGSDELQQRAAPFDGPLDP